MLLDSIVRVGRPISNSSLSNHKRIKYLTDVESDACKNFFKNIFIVEISNEQDGFQFHQLYSELDDNNNAIVNHDRSPAFPFFMPSGGNPTVAQGVYPTICYLAYNKNIKAFTDKETTRKMILSRFQRTVPLKNWSAKDLERLAERVTEILYNEALPYIQHEVNDQNGILTIIDYRLDMYKKVDHQELDENDKWIFINTSIVDSTKAMVLDSNEVTQNIIESRFEEAKELGVSEETTSTLSNQKVDLAVSAYNKTWLWLSPTWEMPRSIYWNKDDWTKGIRLSRDEYESFVYGTQFIKRIQTQLPSTLIKEMFAPVMNAEAKQHMNVTSFETIYGIPFVLPLLERDSHQLFSKYERLLKGPSETEKNAGDLHLEFIAGLRGRILPETSDQYRLTLLYYSGDLSRGNVHIRAMIEDVIPSIASKLERIFRNLKARELLKISRAFNLPFERVNSNRMNFLPSLLSNAFGPGYVWSSMRQVFHRQPIHLDRLRQNISAKLNELANKGSYWQMKQELIFYHSFRYFYGCYQKEIRDQDRSVIDMDKWLTILDNYRNGELSDEDLDTVEKVGFVTGLTAKQFSNSYYHKTGKDFVEHRIMKFGAKLTPEMVWKQGLKESEELAMQWGLKISKNYYDALSRILLRFLDLDKEGKLKKEKDAFMTAFWSGYLMYQKQKGDDQDDNQ